MPRSLSLLLAFLSFFLLVLFIHLGWTCYITDSEIWSVTLAKNIAEEWRSPWVFTRPIFYGTLGLFEHFAGNAVAVFQAAKLASILNGVLIVLFSFRLARTLADRQKTTAQYIPWVALILLLSHTGFLQQGFRIRSDLMACTLVLFALERTLRVRAEGDKLQAKNVVAWLLPLLATPKAALNIIPFAIFPGRGKPREIMITGILIFLLGILIFYPTGVRYVQDLILSPPDGVKFFSEVRFRYFLRLVGSNYLFTAIFLFRGMLFLLRWKRGSFVSGTVAWRQKRFALFTALALLAMIASPEKFPFFLASFVPLFAVFAALICEDVWVLLVGSEAERKRWQPAFLFSLLFVSLILVVAAKRNHGVMTEKDNADEQFRAIRILENYLAEYPKAIYFDVIGLVPQRAKMRFFAGPNDDLINSNTGQWVVMHPPNLIFTVEKYVYVSDYVAHLIQQRYFSLGSGIFARWEILGKPWKDGEVSNLQIYGTVNAMAQAVGRDSLDRFSALVSVSKTTTERVETSIQGIPMLLRRQKGLKILALSPFTDLPILPQHPLSKLFRFDTAF